MRQREYYFQQQPLVSILLELGEQEVALEQLRNGSQLRTSAAAALEAAVMLLKYPGLEEESRRIFEIAEPYELMRGSPSMIVGRADDNVGLLENWVRLAVFFRGLGQVIDKIRHVEYEEVPSTDSTSAAISVQSRLLFVAGLELLARKRWSDLSTLLDAFDPNRGTDMRTRFWLHFQIYRDLEVTGDKARASQHLTEMLGIDRRALGPDETTALAEAIFRLQGDRKQARALIAGVTQPEIRRNLVSSNSGLEPFFQRFRLNRLLYVLGNRRYPSEIVPDPSDPRDRGVVLFERSLCTMAHIWGRAWTGQTMNQMSIESETLPLLRLFSRPFEETQGWVGWFTNRYAKDEFYSLLVQTVAQHSVVALEVLWQIVEREWKHPVFGRYWATDTRRSVIRAFVRNGFPAEWGRDRLGELDELMVGGMELLEHVEECIRHAEAWVEFGDYERAKCLVNSALEVGFGIGYRKDFQMNKWIRWLGRINDVEPEHTRQRVLTFARAIEGLGDSTEGPAASSAAEQLLTVTFPWSPVAATQLYCWFLERGLISHQTGVRALVTEAMKTSKPPTDVALQVVNEFVIPFDTVDKLCLLPLLVKSFSQFGASTVLFEESRALADRIRRYANPAVRPKWLSQLKQSMQEEGLSTQIAGLDKDAVQVDPDDSRSQELLTRSNGFEPLSRQEVEGTVSSVSDISSLLEMEAEDSFFDWTPVIIKMANAIGHKEPLFALAKLFQARRHASEILAHISMRLRNLGSRKGAWQIGVQALEASSEYGWNARYDGGTRMLALEALNYVDKDSTVPLVYTTLISDLQSNPLLVTDIASNLYDILPLLSPQFSVPHIWREIEQHTAPFLGYDPTPMDLASFGATDLSDTTQTALVQLTAIHLDHSCPGLAQASQRALGKLLLARTSEVPDLLKYFLTSTEGYQERVLMLLEAVSLTDPGSILGFQEQVGDLANSPNWSLRLMAYSIIEACGWEVSVTGFDRISLPAIYEISLPPQLLDVREDAVVVSPGEPIPDSEDPHRIVSPFNNQIGLISQAANVPEENTCRRIVDIMHSLGPRESTWSVQAEKRLRASLNTVGIRSPFVRPRARFARRAMFRAVGELIDAGRIQDDAARNLEACLRTHDPQMVLAEPSSRPTQLRPIADLTIGDDIVKWVEEVAEALPYTDWSTSEGTIVLAERTHFRGKGNWDTPTEDRYSTLESSLYAKLETVSDPGQIFGTAVKALVSEYPQSAEDSDSAPIVVRNVDYGYDSPGADWVAFKAAMALRFGWTASPDGMFRWVDSQGQTMVESIWWTDGLPASSPIGYEKGGVGEGWFVLASQSAVEEIQRELGPLYRKSIVTRRFTKKGKPIDRLAVSRYPM